MGNRRQSSGDKMGLSFSASSDVQIWPDALPGEGKYGRIGKMERTDCAMKKLLYLTDLYYHAAGRRYREEDLIVTEYLRNYFDIALCHPRQSRGFEACADLIVFRNTGSVILYQEDFDAFKQRVRENRLPIFNEFTGKGDMAGKQYLVDLTAAGFPVIPTVDRPEDMHRLPACGGYAVKPKNGADSIGLKFLDQTQLARESFPDRNTLIQPAVDFVYEVSFYFINDTFQYAMYAPDKKRRWELAPYAPTEEDLRFARKFIDWNDIRCGIQRIDACRTKEGQLLLMELEDLNPYLSFECLDDATQKKFLADFNAALHEMLEREDGR